MSALLDPAHEGCRNCAMLPGDEEFCEGPPEKWGHWVIGWHGDLVDDRMETADWALLRMHEVIWRRPARKFLGLTLKVVARTRQRV